MPMISERRSILSSSITIGSSSIISLQIYGFLRFIAPTCTAVAPAIIISITSRAELTPPQPITGTLQAFDTWCTIRTATGNILGPEKPPITLAITGRRRAISMRMPSIVFIKQIPSAPASSHAFAIATMSVTLGESLMYTGLVVTALTARVTSAAASGDVPNDIPPWRTLGQLTFTSIIPTCSSLSMRSQQ